MSRCKPWTTTEVDILRSMSGKITIRQASEILGRSYSSVNRKCLEMSIAMKAGDIPDRRKTYAEDIAEAMELKGLGLNYNEIAFFTGRNESSLRTSICTAKRLGFEAYPKRN